MGKGLEPGVHVILNLQRKLATTLQEIKEMHGRESGIGHDRVYSE
jgi:hypothetical protein